jgi:hypothetical protein
MTGNDFPRASDCGQTSMRGLRRTVESRIASAAVEHEPLSAYNLVRRAFRIAK